MYANAISPARRNEEGRRPMTKKELETLIDSRWKSALRRLEEQLAELERRIAWAKVNPLSR